MRQPFTYEKGKPHSAPKRLSGWIVLYFFSAMAIYAIPHITYVLFDLSTFSYGLFLSTFVIWMSPKSWRLVRPSNTLLLLFSVVGAYALTTSLISLIYYHDAKPLLSFFLTIYLVTTALSISNIIKSINVRDLSLLIALLSQTILLIGWIAIFITFAPMAYASLDKPVFPFYEQSHYALIVGPLAIAQGATSNQRVKIYIAISLFFQALLFPSLTLMMLAFFAVVVFWGSTPRIALIFTPLVFAVAFIVLTSSDPSLAYFSSRTSLSNDSDNISTLVFLQGLQSIKDSFVSTYGLGYGFQRLGEEPPSDIAYAIKFYKGVFLNRYDGSFLAAKLGAELGIIGLLIVLAHAAYSVRLLRHSSSTLINETAIKTRAFSAIVISFLVEMIFRGYGYFSPSAYIALIAIISLSTMPGSEKRVFESTSERKKWR